LGRTRIQRLIASLATLVLSNGWLRSLRCSPVSRRLRRSDETIRIGESLLFRRVRQLLPHISGANIVGADRAQSPPTWSSLADEKRVAPSSSARRRAIPAGQSEIWIARREGIGDIVQMWSG